MSVPEARSHCAALTTLQWDDAIVSRELARATAAFLSASPQVSAVPDAAGTWWIGATGFDELGGERLLARTLQQVARVWHPGARVGIADSCVAARAATWAASKKPESEPRIVPPGGCAAYLAAAPIALLPMNEELREALIALGLNKVGAFAALAAGDVEQRWGAEGLASWRLANGEDLRRPVLTRTDVTRRVSTELPMTTETMEPVLFIVRGALGQLITSLVHDGRAAAAIAITLTLDDGRGALTNAPPHTITREVRMPKPLARVAPLFERCRALLDEWTLTAPVCAVSVAITATAPMGAEQGELLAAAWRDPAAADAAFERLRSALGANSVVRPIALDAHRPDLEAKWAELYDTTKSAHRSFAQINLAAPTRFLETPEPVRIETVKNVPRTMHWRGQRIAITRAAGPERISGDWWKEKYARVYWRCESDDLARDFLLYRDPAGWRLQGWFD
jgi:protein ImuB